MHYQTRCCRLEPKILNTGFNAYILSTSNKTNGLKMMVQSVFA